MVGLILGLALAQDVVTCPGPWPEPEAALSVAWVSPLGKQVGNNRWLTVVPTAELRSWGRGEGKGSIARLLQHLGMRRRGKEPRRAYKVVVFDVPASALCRPLTDREGGETASGVLSCIDKATRLREANNGCGMVTDYASEETTPVYRARWRDVVANGFCVLPADRFLGER